MGTAMQFARHVFNRTNDAQTFLDLNERFPRFRGYVQKVADVEIQSSYYQQQLRRMSMIWKNKKAKEEKHFQRRPRCVYADNF